MSPFLRIALVFVSIAFAIQPTVAQQWQHPYLDGTTQVYHKPGNPEHILIRHYGENLAGELRFYTLDKNYNSFYQSIRTVGDPDKLVFNPDPTGYDFWEDLPEGLPFIQPATDSIWVKLGRDTVAAFVERRFDTTVNSTLVRAFVLTIPRANASIHSRYTIADRYGIVGEYSVNHGEYVLHSMHSDAVSFNWDAPVRRMAPICDGDTFQFHLIEKCMSSPPFDGRGEQYISYTTTPGDTLHGHQYYYTTFGQLREDTEGVYIRTDSITEKQVSSSRLTIGSPIRFYPGSSPGFFQDCIAFVTDTATEVRYGKERFVAKTGTYLGAWDWPGCLPLAEVVEGVGYIITPVSTCMIDPPLQFVWDLLYFSVCGETRGTFVATPSIPEPASFTLSPAYPNPVGAGQSAVIELTAEVAGTALLTLYNEAGMLVRDWSQECAPGVTTVHLRTAGLSPGAYRMTTRLGNETLSTVVVVQ